MQEYPMLQEIIQSAIIAGFCCLMFYMAAVIILIEKERKGK
jgi:hypothetical protein